MAEINKNALDKSALLVPQLKINENGVAVLPKDAFIETLANGVTKDDVKKVFAERDTFVAGAIHALGQVAIPAMAKDKSLAQVSLKTSVVGDTLNATIHRSKTSRNPQTGATSEIPGAVSIAYKVSSAKTNSGMTGTVVSAIKVDASAEFKD